MKKYLITNLLLAICFLSYVANINAQSKQTEVTLSLNEQFFDTFFDAVFSNLKNPTFTIAENKTAKPSKIQRSSFVKQDDCVQSVTLQREVGGVYTTVRFRDGKVIAPLAFTGKYEVPFVGCLDFTGWAETNVALEFDQNKQALIGRVTMQNVYLNNVPKLASPVLTRFLQSEIDKKVNPVEIFKIEKLSFLLPIQSAEGSLKMKAVGVKTEIANGLLNVKIAYEFMKN